MHHHPIDFTSISISFSIRYSIPHFDLLATTADVVKSIKHKSRDRMYIRMKILLVTIAIFPKAEMSRERTK